jgi:putative spermidine/putrescine transport system permease protein
MHQSRTIAGLPYLPIGIFFLIIFVFPLIQVFWLSLEPNVLVKKFSGPVTLNNYWYFFSKGFYLDALWRSIWMSVVAVVCALLIAYPTAYILHMFYNRLGGTLILLMTFPLLAGAVPVLLGWMIILSRGGNLNRYLMALGLTDAPIKFLGTELGVIIALTHYVFPFIVLNVFAVLVRIQPSFEEAARNLGAGPIKAFLRITLPLSMPGILSGSLIAFSLAISAYVTPQYIGGSALLVVTTLIHQFMTATFNFQMAATCAVILLIFSLVVIFFYNKVLAKVG